jgi:hypothetical protein
MENKTETTTNSESDRRLAQKITKKLMAGQVYREGRELPDKWAEYQRFWEGDQWPAPTEETQNFPRPVTNHFAEIIEMKTAGMTYEPAEVYFEQRLTKDKATPLNVEPNNPEKDQPFTITREELLAEMFKRVAEHVDLDGLLENKTRSTALLGNGLSYHYFDNTIVGGGRNAGYIGDIGAMEVDISDYYPGDPMEPDVQKQPSCIVTEIRPLDEVKEEYEQFSEYASMLKQSSSDDSKSIYDHQKTTYTEGEPVQLIHYWEKKIKEVEKTINPGSENETSIKVRRATINYYVVAQDYILRKEEDYCERYPIAGFVWYPIRKSFYGKSESDDLINNQKELNRLQGIGLLGAYKMGLANIRYKEGMVDKEDLPVGPGGGFIKDKSGPGMAWSVDYMHPPSIAPQIPLLKEALTQGMKDTSGVHEAWSGKAPSAHLNASAIMALQEAAGVRIKGIRRRMFQSVKVIGEIWLELMMKHYTEDRLYKVFGKNGAEGTVWFKQKEFEGMEFDVKITLNNASPYSKTVIAATLLDMVTNKIIDGDLYLRMLPREVFPKVKELLELLEDRVTEQQQMMLQQQLAVVDEVVAQTIEQARASGVQITPEALQQMQQMIQSVAHEQQI